MLRIKTLIVVVGIFWLTGCTSRMVEIPRNNPGKLKIGFDIDDTILYSEDTFLEALKHSNAGQRLDFGWINTHDSIYSHVIPDMAKLVHFFRAQGHTVYFITARPGAKGDALARFMTRELGFSVKSGTNLFFCPKVSDPQTGIQHRLKQQLIRKLGIQLFYGDSDTDIVAALAGGAYPVRVVRDPKSLKAYSANHFGDLLKPNGPANPFTREDYQRFILAGVGPYGETIYPIYDFSEPLPGFGADSALTR